MSKKLLIKLSRCVLVIIILITFTHSNNTDIKSLANTSSILPVINNDNNDFYPVLLKDCSNRIIRAKSTFEFGEILIKAKESKKISIIQENSNSAERGSISTTNDFDVIYENTEGIKKIITTLKDLEIRQRFNKTIFLKTFKSNSWFIFSFVPEYRNSYGKPLYLFGVNEEGDSVQFNFKTHFADGHTSYTTNLLIWNFSMEDGFLKLTTPIQITETESPRPKSFTTYYKLNLETSIFELDKYHLTYP